MKYFHELNNVEIKELIDKKLNWNDIQSQYLQPEWCLYNNPLDSINGCWSLTDLVSRKVCKEFCKDCDMFKQDKS